MRIVKTLRALLFQRLYEAGRDRALFIGAGLAFRLDDPTLAVAEAEFWKAAVKEVPPPEILDAAFPKPVGEVLVAGAAHAPDGIPAASIPAGFSVGPIRRAVIAYGPRSWRRSATGAVMTPPVPVLSVPLTAAMAYGGPDYAENTVGTGHGAALLLDGGFEAKLPQLEDPTMPIRSIQDAPAPALIGPVDFQAPSRRQLAGSYDQAWFKTQRPGLPLDADWRIFNAAQPVQRLPTGFFTGDEPFVVAGMHARHQRLEGRLPGMRMRAFVARGDVLQEVGLRLETIWLLPGVLLGLAIWRGACPVQEPEARDIQGLMLARERLADAPLGIAHYAEEWRLRSGEETAALHALRGSGLEPPVDEEVLRRRAAAREEARRQMQARAEKRQQIMMDRVLQDMPAPLRDHARAMMPPPVLPDDIPVVTDEELEAGEVDLDAIIRFAEKQIDSVKAEKERIMASLPDPAAIRTAIAAAAKGEEIDLSTVHEAFRGAVEAVQNTTQQIANIPDVPAMPNLADLPPEAAEQLAGKLDVPLPNPREKAREIFDSVIAKVTAIEPEVETDWDATRKRALRLSGGLPEGLAEQLDQSLADAQAAHQDAMAKLAEARANLPPDVQEKLAEAEAKAKEDAAQPQSISAQLDMLAQRMQVDLPPETPPAERERVEQEMAKAKDKLAEMREKMAPQIALAEALAADRAGKPSEMPDIAAKREEVRERLAAGDAQLREGMLKLDEARRIAPRAMAPDKPLDPAVAIRLAGLAQERHSSGEGLEGLDFAGAVAESLSLPGAAANGSLWEKSRLDGADFSGAALEGAVFTEASLRGTRMARARLPKANFAAADLTQADLRGAMLEGAVLQDAVLEGTMLDNAQLDSSVCIKLRAPGVSFRGAVLRQVTFLEADLAGADFTGATLERCIFLSANLTGTSFAGASITRCILTRCDAQGLRLAGTQADRLVVIGGSVAGADLTGMRGNYCTFHGTSLRGATAERAFLPGVVIMATEMAGARFHEAGMRKAMLKGAVLAEARFERADLMHAMFVGADLTGASLRGASLYGANLNAALLERCDLTDANLRGTILELA